MPALGYRKPTDYNHVSLYKLAIPTPAVTVEKQIRVNKPLVEYYNQHDLNACVGFSLSYLSSLNNKLRRYSAIWLWREAQLIDGFPENDHEENEGTTIRAGCDVLRTRGHVWSKKGKNQKLDPNDGISENRWATTIDDIRACVQLGSPVVFGLDWFQGWFNPVDKHGEKWLDGTGQLAGGHAICCIGASDKRQGFLLQNSWGTNWGYNSGKVWIPYREIERQLHTGGEAVIVTDRPTI